MAVGDGASLISGAVVSGNTAGEGSRSLVFHGAAYLAVFDDTLVKPADATYIVFTFSSNFYSLQICGDIEMANGAFCLDGVKEAAIASVGDTVAVTVEITHEFNFFLVPFVTQVKIGIEAERSTLP